MPLPAILQPKTPAGRAGWLAIAMTCVAAFEGLYTHVYLDSVGVPTVCYGMTKADRPIHKGDTYTPEQCKEMLKEDLQKYDEEVMKCVHVPVSDSRHAAIVSFAYNVGTSAACKSTFIRKLNQKDPRACDYLMLWNKAGGRELRGLTNRRKQERDLCYK